MYIRANDESTCINDTEIRDGLGKREQTWILPVSSVMLAWLNDLHRSRKFLVCSCSCSDADASIAFEQEMQYALCTSIVLSTTAQSKQEREGGGRGKANLR